MESFPHTPEERLDATNVVSLEVWRRTRVLRQIARNGIISDAFERAKRNHPAHGTLTPEEALQRHDAPEPPDGPDGVA